MATCTHLDDLAVNAPPTAEGCVDCLAMGGRWVHLRRCLACGHVQYYQQGICRACGSERLEHRPASGRGRVHSYSGVHRAPGPAFKADTPYAVLLVELAEGPRMISSLVGADPSTVAIDMAVELVCERVTDEVTLPRFRPATVA